MMDTGRLKRPLRRPTRISSSIAMYLPSLDRILRGWKTYLKQSSDNETYLAVNDIHGFVNASEHRADCIVGLDFSTQIKPLYYL